MSARPEHEPVNQTAASNLEAGRDINIDTINQNIYSGNQESDSVTHLTRQENHLRQVLLNKVPAVNHLLMKLGEEGLN